MPWSVEEWPEENNIGHPILEPTYHYHSNAIVERFNPTLKQKFQKYMVANDTKKWLDALPDVVYAYNRSQHSYHSERPNDEVKTPQRSYCTRMKRYILNRLRAGTQVRILRKTDGAYDPKVW